MKFSVNRANDDRAVLRWRIAKGAVLVAGALASGCTDYEPASDTLETRDGMLSADPSSAVNDWACLANAAPGPSPGPVNGANAQPATFSLPLIDFVRSMPPAGARGRACAITDPGCASPLTDYVPMTSDGVLVLRLFQGFDGFIEILADGMIPEMFFLNEAVMQTTESYPTFVVPAESGAQLIETLGVPFDDRFGFIGYWVLDCDGVPAEGVLMSNDAGGVVYNFVDGVPAFQPTTADGIGGILNVPPGRVLVRAIVSRGGQTVAVRSFVVRAGWISVINLQPEP